MLTQGEITKLTHLYEPNVSVTLENSTDSQHTTTLGSRARYYSNELILNERTYSHPFKHRSASPRIVALRQSRNLFSETTIATMRHCDSQS